MSQIWAKSNFQLVSTVGRYLRKATLNKYPVTSNLMLRLLFPICKHSCRLVCLRSHVLRACCNFKSKQVISITLFGNNNQMTTHHYLVWICVLLRRVSGVERRVFIAPCHALEVNAVHGYIWRVVLSVIIPTSLFSPFLQQIKKWVWTWLVEIK